MKHGKNIFLGALITCFLAVSCSSNGEAERFAQAQVNTAVAKTLEVITTALAQAAKPTATAPLPTLSAPTATTATPRVTPNVSPVAVSPGQKAGTVCDWAAFISDITVPDGSLVPPGMSFTKTWAIKNIGSCAWTKDYKVFFLDGDLMGAPYNYPLTSTVVNPGETVRVSVPMVAPNDPKGHYTVHRGYWKFMNAKGEIFGAVGNDNLIRPLWVDIKVGNDWDFISNICAATWSTTVGTLPCPNAKQDIDKGYYYVKSEALLENAEVSQKPVIIVSPPKTPNGVIWAQFAPVIVPPWSRLMIDKVGCLNDQPNCSLTFKVNYSVDGGPEKNLFQYSHNYGEAFSRIDERMVDRDLVGKSVSFIFYVQVNGNYNQSVGYWMAPILTPGD